MNQRTVCTPPNNSSFFLKQKKPYNYFRIIVLELKGDIMDMLNTC